MLTMLRLNSANYRMINEMWQLVKTELAGETEVIRESYPILFTTKPTLPNLGCHDGRLMIPYALACPVHC